MAILKSGFKRQKLVSTYSKESWKTPKLLEILRKSISASNGLKIVENYQVLGNLMIRKLAKKRATTLRFKYIIKIVYF